MTISAKLGWWLRSLADRIDDAGAPKAVNLSYTIEEGIGMVIHSGPITSGPNRLGCQLWYLGEDDHRLAFTDAGKRTAVHVSTPLKEGKP